MYRKKIRPKLNLKYVVVGVFSSALLILEIGWLLTPRIVDWGLRYLSKGAAPDEFSLEVEQADPWETRINEVVFKNQEANFSIGNLHIQYDPSGLAVGDINSFTVRNLLVSLDGKAILDNALEENATPEHPDTQWLEQIGNFLSDPELKHLRILSSMVSINWPDFKLPLNFQIKGDYNEGLARTTFDGVFADFPFLSELRFWREEESTYADVEIEFTDLNKSDRLIFPMEKFSGLKIGNDFSIHSGDLVMQGIGRIDGNRFTDLFFEFNGSEIAGQIDTFFFSIEKVISFLTPKDDGDLDFQAYANIQVPDYADLKGVALGVVLSGEKITLRPAVQNIQTSESTGQMNIRGLSLPVVDINLSKIEEFSLGQPFDLYFDYLGYENDSINLVDGSLKFLWLEDQELLSVKMPPLNAVLTDLNIRLFGLALTGLINPSNPFYPEFNQVISCKSALLGDDALVGDLSLSFRPVGASTLKIDSLTAKLAGVMTDCSPANFTISSTEISGDAYRIDFNGSDIRLAKNKVVIEGLSGAITVKSFDPLLTSPSNLISFQKLTAGDLILEDGNFTFAVNEDGEFVILDFFVKVFGGSMQVESAKWKMYSDYVKLQAQLSDVDGQQIVDFFDGLDVRIEGNFSGLVSFSNYEDIWDFGTGFLQLNPSNNAYIKFGHGDLIYGGGDPSDPQTKDLKLTAWALEDLAVDGMRINFKVLENERQIIMSINGVRETDGQKVDLDYKPRFIGGLQDLLKWKENTFSP